MAHADTDLATIPDTVATARRAFDDGRTRPIEWRRRQLDGLLTVLDVGAAELVAALGRDMGKPAPEAHFTDIGTTATDIKHIRKHLAAWMRPRKAKMRMQDRPGKGHILPEPLGVALIIAPWNYPVQLTLGPLAAALAAGNTAVVKPSELVPETSGILARLLREHLDPEAVAVVEGGPEVSTALLDQRFDHIFFTGSTSVGRVVAQAAAKHLTPTVLELGGKSPVIVASDVNLDITAKRLAWGKSLNAGQTCIAPDYVLVDRRHKDALVAGIVAAIEQFYGPDPSTSDDLAKIVNERHAERITKLLADHGGTVACGGAVNPVTRKLAPTVIVDPDPGSALMQEEIFGPVLPILAVDDVDEAVAFINRRPKPLALYVFSNEAHVAEDVAARTSSGGVCVNHVMFHIGPPELPFGGVGDAGHGRYHGQAGFDALSNLKPVYIRPFRPDLSLIYPPYTKLKVKLLTR
ncbi:aldehyde dehydrogenase family protein [Aquihabitans sp. McL0605]|uniref:aldehyde dehydrogenase family protein n=1 Tax=Aquihabitans sp. McL0605 TaxID=3415671 RepID=UPI003CF3B19A